MMWDVDVYNEMDRLRREMNSLFSSYGLSAEATMFPLFNLYDDKENLIVTAELPGLTKNQVNITFADNVLAVSGQQQPLGKAKEMAVVRKERPEGAFEKTLRIPTKVNQNAISAAFNDGVLTITLPIAEEAKAKTITIDAK